MGGQQSTRRFTLDNRTSTSATGQADGAVEEHTEKSTNLVNFSDGRVHPRKEIVEPPINGINFSDEVLERLRQNKAAARYKMDIDDEGEEKSSLSNSLQTRREKIKFAVEAEFKKAIEEIKNLSKKTSSLCTFETY